MGQLIVGDVRDALELLPSASVQCCVTSPPYFGLRDYGNAGQIGLEATPAAYVSALVAVFRDVRRVLKDDGLRSLRECGNRPRSRTSLGYPHKTPH